MKTLFKNCKVNNEIDAYLLGFFYADGFVTSKVNGKYYIFGITLSGKDGEFLDKLADILLGVEVKMGSVSVKDKSYKTASLVKCDVKFVSDVIKLGIIPNKIYSNDSSIINNIPNDLVHHFIRGFFDGDGCIYKTEKSDKRNTYAVGFVSCNVKLLEKISEIISDICSIKMNKVFWEKGKYGRLRYKGNNQLIKIRDFMYRDASLYLKRKKEPFNKLLIYNGRHGHIGLNWHKANKKWTVKMRGRYLGSFKDREEAISLINKKQYV